MPSRRFWLLATVALTVALCGFGAKLWLVREYGNPTPYMDQWDGEAAGIYLPYFRGELTAAHFWAPHNEHRIVWTRLLALGVLEANGQWDPLLQMSVNAALHSLLAVALVAWLGQQVRGRAFALGTLLILAAFALPFAWENTLQGFQSQFYFLALFAFGHLVLTLGSRPGSGRWWVGALCGVAGLGASSGGFAAPLASALVVAVRAWSSRERSHWTWIHLGGALLLTSCGLAAVHHVPLHDALRVTSPWQFLLALLNTAGWPANFWLPLGALIPAPFVAWAWTRLRSRQFDAGDATLLGLGTWGLLQCAALAISRGNFQLAGSPRYADLATLLVIASAIALGRLRAGDAPVVRSPLLPAGWWLLVSAGLTFQTTQTFERFLNPMPAEWKSETALLADYVRGGDRAKFLALDPALLPYPAADKLAAWLDQPELRPILPAALRAPVKLTADPTRTRGFQAGVGNTLPADKEPVSGARAWTSVATAGGAEFRSAPLSDDILPVLQFRFAGSPSLPIDAFRLEPAGGGDAVAPEITRWIGTRWQSANLARPAGQTVVVAHVPAGQALALAEPVELGRWSWHNRSLLKLSDLLCLGAVVPLGAALLALLLIDRRERRDSDRGRLAPALVWQELRGDFQRAAAATADFVRTVVLGPARRAQSVVDRMRDRVRPFVEGRGRGPWALACWSVAALYVALAFFSGPIALNTELDSSWHATLIEAHRHGWQFGRELNFTAGPWGWVTSLFAPADAFDLRVASDLAWRLFGMSCIAATAWPLRPLRRWLMLVTLLLFGGIFPDTLPLLALTGLVTGVLFRPDARAWALGAALVALTFLAQVKFTFALLGTAGSGLAVALHLVGGRRGRALGLLSGFAAGFVGWWLAAGQELANLPDYLRFSWEIASGYPQAMGVDEPVSVLFAGLATLGVGALWLITTAIRARRAARIETALRLGFVALLGYVAWKHGFTRGDHHVCGFFEFAMIAGFALPGWFDRDTRWTWLDLTWLPALVGFALFDAGLLRNTGAILVHRTTANFTALTELDATRERHRRETESNARRSLDEFGDLKKQTAGARIDLLGFEQGALILQGANLAPRPIFQSYSAYTPALLDANAAYFAGPRAPEYALLRFHTIDGRYPAQDESTTLLELAGRYELVEAEHRRALLRLRADRRATPAPRVTSHGSTTNAWGQTLELPPADGALWWLRVEVGASLSGRIHDFAYKPAQIAMTVTDQHGREFRHRLIPRAAERGFAIQPLLETQADANAFLAGEARTWVRSVRLDPMNPAEAEFLGDLTVHWERRAEFPLRKAEPYHAYVEAKILPSEPVAIEGFAAPSLADTPAGRAMMVHAPSEVTLPVPDGAMRVKAGFGLLPGAWTSGGESDGADFALEAELADGRRIAVWHHALRPATTPADRAEHALDVSLPAGTRLLRLRTGPGPAGANSWDWTYWRAIHFSP